MVAARDILPGVEADGGVSRFRVITFKHVSKRYAGGASALLDVNFHIDAGEMVFLTGHSGAGKSTLLRLILMLERASGGQVVVNGRNLGKTAARLTPQVRRQIGMIFQDHKLLRDKTVFDNVSLPLMIAGVKHWTLTSLQTRLIKTGGRLVRHARRLVFQLAEVLVTREMLTGILERISQLRLAPG